MIVVPQNDAQNELICRWVAERIGQDEFKNARGMAFTLNGKIVGGAVLHDYAKPNVFVSWALEKGGLTRSHLLAVLDWAFNQLGCERMTGLVEKNNRKSRKLCEHLGMKLEGVLRKAAPSGRDLFVYGFLRSEAEALVSRLRKDNGKAQAD